MYEDLLIADLEGTAKMWREVRMRDVEDPVRFMEEHVLNNMGQDEGDEHPSFPRLPSSYLSP